METTAVRDGDEWVINGEKYWNTGLHHATHDSSSPARPASPARARHHLLLVPTDCARLQRRGVLWTFNMPTDHAHVS
jgi:acyl-CoA dehydrogenase